MKKKPAKMDKAYLKAVEEIEKDRINEIKGVVKDLLEKLIACDREMKKQKERREFLAKDLDDVRHGRIEKLKKRHAEEKQLALGTSLTPEKIDKLFDAGLMGNRAWGGIAATSINSANLQNAISGTYTLGDGIQVKLT
jgi:hypothetical protein